MEPEPDGSEF
jgi:hypothetical protein